MAGLGGIIPPIAPITVALLGQAGIIAALRPGQIVEGAVQENKQGFLVRIGGTELPIEPVAGLAPGTRVGVEVIRTGAGPRLRLTPLPTPAASPSTQPAQSGSAAPPLPALLTRVLETLNRLDAVRQAAHLLPRGVPRSEVAIRQVLTLFFARGSTGQDLQQVAAVVRQAVDAGVLTERDVAAVASILRLVSAGVEEDTASVLRRAGDQAGKPIEARLAAAVAAGKIDAFLAELDQDAAVLLQRLRSNEAFRTYLRKTGQLADFDSAVDRTIERFSGGHLQNLRSAEMPYHFLEVPFDPTALITHAQIHIFGEGGGKGRRFDPDNSTVVIDLSTTNLGDLWISLNMVRGACQCWIRVTDVEVVRAVEESSADLAEQLEAVGYPGATVHATLWDGNRLQEAANLMRRFEGISLEA